MSDFHSDYSLTIKIKSNVSATLHTNRFTEVPFSLEILQAHKTSAVTQYDGRRSLHDLCLQSGKLLSI